MASEKLVHSDAKLLCWRLLLLVFSFITWFLSELSRLKFLLSSSPDPKKLPRHLALLVDSQDAVPYLSKLLLLLDQLAQLGLEHISLYDAEGTLKLVLADALQSNLGVQIYRHNYDGSKLCNGSITSTHGEPCCKNDTTSTFSHEKKGHLVVEVLCIRDGKQAIVDAARNICLKSLQAGAISDIREEDINTSLKEIGGFGPDPDLLLLFSNSRTLQGFPPWRLRLTEILYVGPIKDMSEATIFQALEEYSYKHHRYGK